MGINYNALKEMLEKGKENGVFIHAMNIIKDGDTVVSFSIPPYNKDDRRQIFSMSKSFTSIAIGICFDEKLISLDDDLSKFFPDEAQCAVDESAKKITIRNLITMSSGHNNCSMEAIRNSEYGPKTFMSLPLDHKSGTEFHYNTGATYMLSAIVQKVTDKKLVDFLDEKLFKPLDIKKPFWACSGGEICEGGVGLFISSEDICKFAKMLYNKGVYNGKRIVSEEYLNMATSKQIDTPPATIDWIQGYGFQFWINREKGFRADGAFGQLCVILEDRHVAYTILGEVHNMQTEMDLCYKMLDELFCEKDIGKNDFEGFLTDYFIIDSEDHTSFSALYSIDKDYEWITVDVCDDKLSLVLKNDMGEQNIQSVIGKYTENEYNVAHLIPDFYQSPQRSMYKNIKSKTTHYFKNDVLYVVHRYTEYPHTVTWRFEFNDNKLKLNFSTYTSQFIEEHCNLNGVKKD